jgi:hypothetical protein
MYMQQQWVQLSKSIMFILLGLSALIFALGSIIHNPLKADMPNQTSSTGKIMMDQNTVVYNGQSYYHILIWDTETGKSKLYYFYPTNAKFDAAKYQLPVTPLQ